jgi:phospholipase C
LTNHDSRALTCTVVSANYSTDRPRTYRVEAHGEATHRVDPLARSHGWYDLMVTCDNDPLFTRRFVGHLENGKPSITG